MSAIAAAGFPIPSMTHMLVTVSVVCMSIGCPVVGSLITDAVPVPAMVRLVITGTPCWSVVPYV